MAPSGKCLARATGSFCSDPCELINNLRDFFFCWGHSDIPIFLAKCSMMFDFFLHMPHLHSQSWTALCTAMVGQTQAPPEVPPSESSTRHEKTSASHCYVMQGCTAHFLRRRTQCLSQMTRVTLELLIIGGTTVSSKFFMVMVIFSFPF